MKKLLVVLLCLCLLPVLSFSADTGKVVGGVLNIGLAVWGFSTGGSGFVIVASSIFAIRGIVKIVDGISE